MVTRQPGGSRGRHFWDLQEGFLHRTEEGHLGRNIGHFLPERQQEEFEESEEQHDEEEQESDEEQSDE